MLLKNYDVNNTSGNPASLISGTATSPFIAGGLEPIDRTVNDQTATTPASVGKLLVQQFTVANATIGGQNWAQSSTSNQALPFLSYGVVYDRPSPNLNQQPLGQTTVQNVGGEATVRCSGVIQAYCVSDTTTAIAAGTPLYADGSGNLTSRNTPPTGAGTCLAIALGTLAQNTTTPTLVWVKVGGY